MPLAPKPKQGKAESCFHWNLSLVPPVRPVIFSPENPKLERAHEISYALPGVLAQTYPNSNSCKWWSLCHLQGCPASGLTHGPLEEQQQISHWLWKTRPTCHLSPPGSPPDGTQPKYLHPDYTAFCSLVLVKLPKMLLPLLGVMAGDKSLSLKRECSWPVPPAYQEWKALPFSKLKKHFALAKF